MLKFLERINDTACSGTSSSSDAFCNLWRGVSSHAGAERSPRLSSGFGQTGRILLRTDTGPEQNPAGPNSGLGQSSDFRLPVFLVQVIFYSACAAASFIRVRTEGFCPLWWWPTCCSPSCSSRRRVAATFALLLASATPTGVGWPPMTAWTTGSTSWWRLTTPQVRLQKTQQLWFLLLNLDQESVA